MSAMRIKKEVTPEALRFLLLAYGMEHPYRVLGQEEIFQSLPGIDREKIKEALDRLAAEGLLTKFSSRYCFNRLIPGELRQRTERATAASSAIRMQD